MEEELALLLCYIGQSRGIAFERSPSLLQVNQACAS